MTTALVFGRAQDVWKEAGDAREMLMRAASKSFDYNIVTGPLAIDFPGPIDAWVWFHVELFPDRALQRARKGYPPVKEYWSEPRKGVRAPKVDLPIRYVPFNGGSSGLVAAVGAIKLLNCDKVVLVGCPMTSEGGQYDTTSKWKDADKHRHRWTEADCWPIIKDKVRSMSGWTQELLGAPTEKWLQQ